MGETAADQERRQLLARLLSKGRPVDDESIDPKMVQPTPHVGKDRNWIMDKELQFWLMNPFAVGKRT